MNHCLSHETFNNDANNMDAVLQITWDALPESAAIRRSHHKKQSHIWGSKMRKIPNPSMNLPSFLVRFWFVPNKYPHMWTGISGIQNSHEPDG